MKGRRYKRRAHTVPLSSQALDILQQMKAFSGRHRFVFPHSRRANEPMSSETVNMAMKRNGYKNRFTAHGMRAFISTHLNAKGYPEDVVEAVLAHDVRGKVRKVYNRHDYLAERIEVMNYWGNFIEQAGLTW